MDQNYHHSHSNNRHHPLNNKTMKKIKIGNTDIFLENFDRGQGKITISDTCGYNFSNYWGAMGCSLEEFLCQINSDYFSDKMFGSRDSNMMDVKSTFSAIRKHIREEIRLPWYRYTEFQKELRQVLNEFQRSCEDLRSQTYFVDTFYSSFVNRLDYSLIEDRYDSKRMEEEFKNGFGEHWYFIQEKDSYECRWLKDLHKKLKKQLSKELSLTASH